MVNADGRAV